MEETAVGSIPYANEKRLGIWAECHTCDLTKEIKLLPLGVSASHIKYVNKVSRLCHCHELAIRTEAY